MRRWVYAAVVGGALSAGAFAQDQKQSTTVQLPPTPLLPNEFAGYKSADAAAAPALPADLSDAIKKEFIVKREMTNAYQSGDSVMQVRAEQYVDATGAYAAFTALRKPEMRPTSPKVGEDSVASGDTALFWAGPTVVEVSAKRLDLKALQELSVHLPKLGGPSGKAPGLPVHFPKAGLKFESTRYSLGPASYAEQGGTFPVSVIDFSKSPEIATADYSGGGVLTLIYYPTPTIAGDRSRALLAELTAHPPAGTSAESILVKRAGPIVAITTGKLSQDAAKKLIDQVHYETNITWNKPEGYISEASKAAKLLVGIILSVFAMAIAAFVLAIFFGGGRALIRVLRGKPASSVHDAEFIHLDLTGSQIQGTIAPRSDKN